MSTIEIGTYSSQLQPTAIQFHDEIHALEMNTIRIIFLERRTSLYEEDKYENLISIIDVCK